MPDTPLETETIRTVLAHRSVRAFADRPLPDGLVETLREVMRRGPTSSALQAYAFVFVRDAAMRAAISPLAGGQRWIDECGLLIVGCSDQRRVESVTRDRAYPYRASDLRMLVSSVEDMTIAIHNASLAAQSLGLGTVMIGGISNGAAEIHDLLGLPERVVPLLGLCVGVPRSVGADVPARPRIPPELVFHDERYALSPERERELLAQHDRDVVACGYYDGRRISATDIGMDGTDPVAHDAYGWTEHVARKQSKRSWDRIGPKLRDDLARLGLRL